MCHDNMTDAQKRLFDNIITPVKVGPRVKGRFKLRAMKGNIIMRESAWCPNIIVNGTFNYWLQNVNNIGIMGFVAGAGTSTPQATDTSLQSFLGAGGTVEEGWVTRNSTVSPRSVTFGVRIRGNEGAVVGNVAEIALCRGTTGTPNNSSPIFNRARVVDELGNPTAITVLSDEFLEVIYEFTLYAIEGATGTLTINIDGTPTNFDYEIRPINMNNTTWWGANPTVQTGSWVEFHRSGLLAFTTGGTGSIGSHVTGETAFGDPSASSAPAGFSSSNYFTSRVEAPYVPNSKERLQTIRVPLNNGNIAAPGVRSINLALGRTGNASAWCVHQVLLDGPFEKKPTHIFDLPVTVAMDNA